MSSTHVSLHSGLTKGAAQLSSLLARLLRAMFASIVVDRRFDGWHAKNDIS
jgi:hypothetical protein